MYESKQIITIMMIISGGTVRQQENKSVTLQILK
jgi:hypothetical protein